MEMLDCSQTRGLCAIIHKSAIAPRDKEDALDGTRRVKREVILQVTNFRGWR